VTEILDPKQNGDQYETHIDELITLALYFREAEEIVSRVAQRQSAIPAKAHVASRFDFAAALGTKHGGHSIQWSVVSGQWSVVRFHSHFSFLISHLL